MPKFSCDCGEIINLSECPSKSEYVLISEKRITEIANYISDTRLNEDNFYNLIDGLKTVVYVCFNCGRMHLENRNISNEFVTYVPDNNSDERQSDNFKFRDGIFDSN